MKPQLIEEFRDMARALKAAGLIWQSYPLEVRFWPERRFAVRTPEKARAYARAMHTLWRRRHGIDPRTKMTREEAKRRQRLCMARLRAERKNQKPRKDQSNATKKETSSRTN